MVKRWGCTPRIDERPAPQVASRLAAPVEGIKRRDHNATHILRSYLQVLMAFAAEVAIAKPMSVRMGLWTHNEGL